MGRYEQLEAFVEVVDQNSFSAAGEKMGLAKSVLSRRVSELEKRLMVKLLNRTTRKLSLTGAGEQLYQQASLLISGLLEAEKKVSDEQVSLSGQIKLAVPLSFGYRHLSSSISAFVQQHPDIDISLDLNDSETDLVGEGFDMTIRIGKLHDSTLIARKLGIIRFVTVASAAYLKSNGEPKHPSELVNHQGLLYSNVSARQQWQFIDQQQPVVSIPHTRLSANNGDFLSKAAIKGLGIINCPTFLVYDYIRDGKLRIILKDYQPEDMGLYALFAPGRMIPRRTRLLVEFLQQQFGDLPDWDKDILYKA